MITLPHWLNKCCGNVNETHWDIVQIYFVSPLSPPISFILLQPVRLWLVVRLLALIWHFDCVYSSFINTKIRPFFFPLHAPFNLDMFWLPCSASNHIKYLHCGLFSLDPCTSICHITAQPGRATYIPCLLHPSYSLFLLHLAAHSGFCFCCCSGYMNSCYDSYSMREAH